jgi:hypothetical protein
MKRLRPNLGTYSSISLDILSKTTNTLFTIFSVLAGIRTRHVLNTNRKCHSLCQIAGCGLYTLGRHKYPTIVTHFVLLRSKYFCDHLVYRHLQFMRSAVFWDITRRCVVIVYRRFGKTFRSHLHGSKEQHELPNACSLYHNLRCSQIRQEDNRVQINTKNNSDDSLCLLFIRNLFSIFSIIFGY